MDNLLSILQSSDIATVKLEVSGDDLLRFGETLISLTRTELVAEAVAASKEDRLLTKDEVKSLLGVCDATLWHWARKNYLPVLKIGNKVRYRESDVQKILNNGK